MKDGGQVLRYTETDNSRPAPDFVRNYSEFETILIAPLEFYQRNFDASNIFDRFV